MIPDISNACWRQLVTGGRSFSTQMLGLQMLLKRMQRHLAQSRDEATIRASAEEVRAFFVKYESSLATEINALRG